ncbi:MAG: ABC transporter substrate-binding protein [Proteobacteria bacterium]|nr:ABC transporter substrate-binding protein [Pseudomonadota bacterium]
MTKSLILAILLAAGLSSGSFAANETPNEVVESAVALFAAGLDGRRDELAADRAALYELIDEILLPRFDRKYAAQVVLARHWRDASESQRERFIEAFYQALLRRYADGLLQFESDKVKVLPYRGDASKSRTRVRSTVQLENGSKVAVDYDLVKRESGWLLFNVTIEGISYVRNFRAEIDSEIRSSSLDAAIRRLEREAGISSDE